MWPFHTQRKSRFSFTFILDFIPKNREVHVLTRLYFGLVCTIISFAARFARKYSTLDSLSSFDVLNTTTHEAFCCQAFADKNRFLDFRNSNEFDAFASSFVWWCVGFAREDPMTNSKSLVHDKVFYYAFPQIYSKFKGLNQLSKPIVYLKLHVAEKHFTGQ